MKNDILREREGLSCNADFLTSTHEHSLPNVNFCRFVNKTNNVGTVLHFPILTHPRRKRLHLLSSDHGCLLCRLAWSLPLLTSHCHHDATFTRESHFTSAHAAQISINLIKIQLYSPQVFRNFK